MHTHTRIYGMLQWHTCTRTHTHTHTHSHTHACPSQDLPTRNVRHDLNKQSILLSIPFGYTLHLTAPLQCGAVQLQHTATQCNTMQHTASHCNTKKPCSMIQQNTQFSRAFCFYTRTTLRHIAPRCTTLQHAALHCNTLHYTATHCTTLHHTPTNSNTLQHTGNVRHDSIRHAVLFSIPFL